MKKLFILNWKYFFRYRYESFIRLPPDYIAMLLIILMASVMVVGFSTEEYIIDKNDKLINYNYLFISNLLIPIFFDTLLGRNYYSPNHHFFTLLLPFSFLKKINYEILNELLSYKLLIPITTFIAFLFFSKDITRSYFVSTKIILPVATLFLAYLNASLLTILLKKITLNFRKYEAIKNYMTLVLIVLIAGFITLINIDLIDLYTLSTTIIFLKSAVFMALFLILLICVWEVENDRI